MTDWRSEAKKLGLPAFPVKIKHDGTRWQKKPLVKGWQNTTRDTEWPPAAWDRANGLGFLMGAGIVMLDIDSWKPGCEAEVFLRDHAVTGDTRVHRTPSGGTHAFYRVPAKFGDLPTRANVVPGLDVRGGLEGSRGFAAFGEHYELVKVRPLAMLSDRMCRIIAEGHTTSGQSDLGTMGDYRPPDDQGAILARLQQALQRRPALARRWAGETLFTKPGSQLRDRSAHDMSVAQHLGVAGFSETEIAWLLLTQFEHGQARHLPKYGERAAQRCARRAALDIEKSRKMIEGWQPPEDDLTADEVEALFKEIRHER